MGKGFWSLAFGALGKDRHFSPNRAFESVLPGPIMRLEVIAWSTRVETSATRLIQFVEKSRPYLKTPPPVMLGSSGCFQAEGMFRDAMNEKAMSGC